MSVLTLVLAGEALYLYIQNQRLQHVIEAPSTYEECVTDSESTIRATFPTTCVTKLGDAFIDPHAEIPEYETDQYATLDWQTHIDHDYLFSYECPASFEHNNIVIHNPDGTVLPKRSVTCSNEGNTATISIWNTGPAQIFSPEEIKEELSGMSLIPAEYTEFSIGAYRAIRYIQINEAGFTERAVAIIDMPRYHIRIEGFPEQYVDRILTGFAIIEQ